MQLYFYNGQPTNYSISEDGKVFNNKTKKFLKGQTNKNGYISYSLSLPSDKKRFLAHRMVMETYCPNGNSRQLEVNHINGIKNDNRLENLEWCTAEENKQHARDNNLYATKPIYGFNDNLENVIYYKSSMDLFRTTGWSLSQISSACNMTEKTKTHGYYWSFEPEVNFTIKSIDSGASKRVGQYDLNGNLLQEYPSMSEAARQNNCLRNHIGEVCNGRSKTYKGFIWKYLD